MPMIVEENEEFENDTVERVERDTNNTPHDSSGASATADAFAMIVHNQDTSNVAMGSEHISSFEGTEVCVNPAKEESSRDWPECGAMRGRQSAETSEGGSNDAIGQDTQRGRYSHCSKTDFALPSFRNNRKSSPSPLGHPLLLKKAYQGYPSFRLAAKVRKTSTDRMESFRMARLDMSVCSARTDLLETMKMQRRGFAERIN
ncbi:hypothetical protein TcWFU_003273 [Taenia crassiceps]|uniref:Uncharacterized protein n=1 Tax=Taenia crassiceps TaxID=6207 RepID=A0ABR4Q3Q7_9CEST